MRKSILTYGAISGLIIISINTMSMMLGFGQAWLGFLVMFIVFSIIVVAVKQFRDQQLGGVITFGKALVLGLGISAIASVVYVLVWEIYLSITDYSFVETYFKSVLEAKNLAGLDELQLAAAVAETEQMKAQYYNPFIRVPMSVLEIFPVGLLISIITAITLRNHKSTIKTGA